MIELDVIEMVRERTKWRRALRCPVVDETMDEQ